MYKYQIRYTTSFGERKTYMNIGFDTKQEAKLELDRINNRRNTMKGIGYFVNRPDDFNSFRTYQGSNFRIKKVKCFPL